MNIFKYKVYVKTDERGRITAINSDAFLSSLDGWLEIDSGTDIKHHHAQGNYLKKPLMDEKGLYRYKLEGGKVIERTQEEMDADYVPPVQQPSEDERITAIEQAMTAIEEGIKSV